MRLYYRQHLREVNSVSLSARTPDVGSKRKKQPIQCLLNEFLSEIGATIHLNTYYEM